MSYEEKLKIDTSAEIARVENYLKDLKKFQSVIDPPKVKRKYIKRKNISPGNSRRSSERTRKVAVLETGVIS